jgi:hypothetical protein
MQEPIEHHRQRLADRSLERHRRHRRPRRHRGFLCDGASQGKAEDAPHPIRRAAVDVSRLALGHLGVS